MNTLGLVLIRGGNDLDDLIARKFEFGNVHRAAVHQVGVQHTENGLVSNDEQIILLALKLEDNWLEADGEVMIRLKSHVNRGELIEEDKQWPARVNAL